MALGYGLAAVVATDQLVQLTAALPLDVASRLGWFQVATAAAPRLVLLMLAGLIALSVGVRLRHRRAVVVGSLVLAAAAVAAVLVVRSVIWDGTHVLSAYGPPGGNLAAFQGQRMRSLIHAGLALTVVVTSIPVVRSAPRLSTDGVGRE